MKIIQFPQERLTVEDLMELAKEQAIVLRQSNGSLFALAPVEDFEVEVEILRNNAEFMAFLKQLSEGETSISLQALREELAL